jgi:uncharacterized membrane protein
MSQLIVVSFEKEETAAEALDALRAVQHAGGTQIHDAAVIQKDPDGKAHVKGSLDSGALTGAAIGGALGLVLFIFFPILGVAIGAIGGGIVGHAVSDRVDKDFVKEVSAKLDAGHSALFVLLADADPAAVLSALRPIEGGTLIQTTLDEELEEEVRQAVQ